MNTLMRFRFLLLAGCILCIFGSDVYGQTDTKLWTAATFRVRFNKMIRISVEEQFRFNDTLSSFQGALSELGLRYCVNKRLSVKGGYRYFIGNGSANSMRYTFDVSYRWRKKSVPVSFSYRFRFQNSRENSTGTNKTYLRNRFSVGYRLSKRINPYLSYGLYYRLNGKNEFRAWRLTGGIDWSFSKRCVLTTFYRYSKEINVMLPEADRIIGVMFSYTFRV